MQLPRKKRPLAHLTDEHLLCSGWLANWRASNSGFFKEICLESIDCHDWATGKKQLAHLEHCWMRVTPECWETLYRLGLRDGHKTSRLDKLFFVAKPEYYRRRDASEDWGLYLLSSPPITELQAQGVHTDFRKLSKPQAVIPAPLKHYKDSLITSFLLEQKLEDWRLYSKKGPGHALSACKVVRRNAEAGLRSKFSQAQLEQTQNRLLAQCQIKANAILMGNAEQLYLSRKRRQRVKVDI